MAEGRARSGAKVLCRYFLNGCCRDGSSCKFSHDRTTGVPDNVCRYYLQGCCSFSERCRYDHIRPNSSAKNRNDVKNKSNKQGGPSRPASSPNIPLNSQNKISRNVGSRNSGSTAATVRMTVLKKQNASEDSGLGDEASHSSSPHTGPGSPDWVNAPEFIPRTNKSYADTVRPDEPIIENRVEFAWEAVCQYAQMDKCPNGESCSFIHFETCELCQKACLHPTDKEQRAMHIEECEKELVQEMEHSFAMQRSQGKSCGICMDVVVEKIPPVERRFGILEKCNHVFCLSCIRQWRKTKQFESRRISSLDPFVIRACPECRVVSDFVTPSKYWVDTKEEKEKLIADYKKALSTKPCKYFREGQGECPFGGACFYLHAFPDGTKAELPPPRPRRRQNQDGELQSVDSIFLWDFFEIRDDLLFHLEFDEVFGMFSDSDDDSDWSDIGEEYLVD